MILLVSFWMVSSIMKNDTNALSISFHMIVTMGPRFLSWDRDRFLVAVCSNRDRFLSALVIC